MNANDQRIAELIDIFSELADTGGGMERTSIWPSLTVIDANPATLGASYIIIEDSEGFYIPALKVPGVTYTNGDLVNVLFIKGTEPIAFQQGPGSGGSTGGNVWPLPNKANIAATQYDTLPDANTAAVAGELIRLGEGDFVLSSDFLLATHIAGSGRQVSIIGLGNNVDFTDTGGWSIQDVAIDVSGSTTTISLVDTILMDCILGNMPITLDNCFVGGGEIYGNITCLNTPYFNFPLITGTVTGTFAGYYLDVSGNIVPGVAGWPFDKILTVSTTDPNADYSTIAAAITAANVGEAIWLDSETFTETLTVNKAITIFSAGAIITSAADFTVTVTAAAKLFNLTITNSGTGAVAAPVHLNGASSVVIDNCTLNKSSGAATIGAGLYTSTSSNIGIILRNTRFLSNAGTTRYGIYNTIFTTGTMYAGEAGGTNGSLISTDVTPSILVLNQLPLLQGAISFTGAAGWYNDINGNIVAISNTISLNGIADALILDADQDTTISAPTDDQIDFEAGGADVATLTASGLALASGARINEFSTDGTMAGDSDTATPTEQAVNEFVTLIVKNTSGATANAGEMGYLTYTAGSGIEYKTTTTAGDNKADRGCVVIVGGANNANIKLRRNGRWTIPYAGSAPAQGDFLVFSTTAGKVAAQSYMSPGVVGIAMAAGSGGNVDALLLCNTVFVEEKITVCWALLNHSDFDFVATINGAPSGTSVVYNAPSAGNEDCLNIYTAEGSNWKLTLHNTTRGTSALIASTNTGTNTITLTATVPAGWASGDTITIRSQTQTTTISGAYFVDINTNGTIPALTRALLIPSAKMDTGAASERVDLAAFQAALVSDIYRTQVANVYMEYKADIPVINGRFCLLSTASGTGTGNTWLRQSGYWVAAP